MNFSNDPKIETRQRGTDETNQENFSLQSKGSGGTGNHSPEARGQSKRTSEPDRLKKIDADSTSIDRTEIEKIYQQLLNQQEALDKQTKILKLLIKTVETLLNHDTQ